MTFKHDKSWENLEIVLNSKLPIKDAWNGVIDFHEQTVPRNYWPLLKDLDVEAEQQEIKTWLEKILTDNPLPEQIVALWIGIVKLLDVNNKERYAIYLTGSDSYQEEDVEWAVEPTYEPEDRYKVLEILNQIDSVIKKDKDNYSFLDWILSLAYCSLTIDEIVRTKLKRNIFLKIQNNLSVVTGHDSGDYIQLSSIT